ncbi:hypothetical protein ACFO9Q_04225 [Paenibacillus sp. GCM10023252]|uniref:hypothetical protein n=1 Tax=Paenibacillus sp. GCM10023252 TaxID=3252649 RepID=UPI0036203AD9
MDWLTLIVLTFGILVAVFGVVAYLRMFRKDSSSILYRSGTDTPPPIGTGQPVSQDESLGNDGEDRR